MSFPAYSPRISRNLGEIRRAAFREGGEGLARLGGAEAQSELLAFGIHLRDQRLAVAHQLLGGGERAGWLTGRTLRERKHLGIEPIERHHAVGEPPLQGG